MFSSTYFPQAPSKLFWTRTLFLILCSGLFGFAIQSSAEDTPLLMVVDVSKVFSKYEKVRDTELQLESHFRSRRVKLEEQERQLRKFGTEVSELRSKLDGNNEQLFDTVQRMQRMEFLYRKQRLMLEEDIRETYRLEMRDILNEIRATMSEEAKLRNTTIVMRTPDTLEFIDILAEESQIKKEEEQATEGGTTPEDIGDILKPRSTFQLVKRFKRNPVLFAADHLDATDAVLNKLNADYKNKGGAKSLKNREKEKAGQNEADAAPSPPDLSK